MFVHVENHVPDFKRMGLWDDICKVRNVLVYHAESLMYNSILAKFVGGKQIHFSHKCSYELRCNSAVTDYQYLINT